MGRPPHSYQDAGLDIDRGNALVERIKPLAQGTVRAGVMGGVSGFGALFRLAGLGYRDPILVSSTDGVGTKQKLAVALDGHDTIGIDLVAMCVNDVVVQGAEPLFFLDYFATGGSMSRSRHRRESRGPSSRYPARARPPGGSAPSCRSPRDTASAW